MRLLKSLGIIALASTMLASASCSSLVVQLITQPTSDLREAAVIAGITSNLYSKNLKTIEMDYAGDFWKEGSNVLMVRLMKRKGGIGFFRPDGKIGYLDAKGNFVPMEPVLGGVFAAVLPKGDFSPKTIIMTTTKGQESRITVKPVQPITIKSINGQKEGAVWDISKDLVLELNVPADAKKMRLGLIVNQAGNRALTTLGFFKATPKVTVPKEVLKHIANSASHEGFSRIVSGANWLQVERYEDQVSYPEPLGALENLSVAWDTVPLTLKGETPWALNGISADQKVNAANGPIRVAINSGNAFTTRPLKSGMKFALAGLSVRGQMVKKKTETSTREVGNVQYTTTTTTTWKFPTLPEATWDKMMTDTYASLKDVFKSQGVELVPPDRLAGSRTYKEMEIPPDSGSGERLLERNYPGARSIFPGMWAMFSSTFAGDAPASRILREVKLDGLVTAEIMLNVGGKKDDASKVVLYPVYRLSMSGPENGWLAPLSYGNITLDAEDGVPFNEQAVKTIPGLSKAIRKDEMIGAFKQGLGLLKSKQEAEGFHKIWALN